jgi:hypothetical protein
MTELTEKEALLETSGYRYHFDRMIYFNRATRRALSLEFVEDNPLEEIRNLVNQPPDANGWIFYFNEQPSDRTKRELAEAFG